MLIGIQIFMALNCVACFWSMNMQQIYESVLFNISLIVASKVICYEEI